MIPDSELSGWARVAFVAAVGLSLLLAVVFFGTLALLAVERLL